MWFILPKTAVGEHYFSGTSRDRDGTTGPKLTGREGTPGLSKIPGRDLAGTAKSARMGRDPGLVPDVHR